MIRGDFNMISWYLRVESHFRVSYITAIATHNIHSERYIYIYIYTLHNMREYTVYINIYTVYINY